MRVIAKGTLTEYWAKHRDAEAPLRAWLQEAKAAAWSSPPDVKAAFGSASILKTSRVVFNIAGNKHRLVVSIHYRRRVIYIKFIGTHTEYDAIDAETVEP